MKRERRWKVVALLAAGIAIGIVLTATPAVGHVSSWTHNWKTHIRPKADVRYNTKAQATALFKNRAATAGSDENTNLALTEYSTWTTVAETNLATTGASSQVLVTGQVTVQNTSGANGDLFARVTVDGVLVDGPYWSSLGHTAAPVFNRTQLAASAVISLGPGSHVVRLQASYWDGGTDRNVSAYARRISAVELN
jgi:hypothetical protein